MDQLDKDAFLFARDCLVAGVDVVLATVTEDVGPIGRVCAIDERGTLKGHLDLADILQRENTSALKAVLDDGEPRTVTVKYMSIYVMRIG